MGRAALGTAVLAALGFQGVREQALPPAQVEFAEGFTSIAAVRELRDGRVLVVDSRDAVVKLVDLVRGTAIQIGRQGAGPGEYRGPQRLLVLNGDSTLLTDGRQQRSIIIGPDGVAGEVFLAGKELLGVPAQARAPAATDGRGRLYFAGSALDMARRPDAEQSDSAPIIRLDPVTGRLDSLTLIKVAKREININRVNGKVSQVSVMLVPLRPHDDWAVLPDGRLAIVRTAPYRLDIVRVGGEVFHGPAIAYSPIAVTAADRKQSANWGELLPRIKPPFDGSSTELAPDGRLWVRRTTAFTDSTARYDVLDLTGKLVARVALPARTELAGFGRNVVYLVRRDEDDLEYLGRVPLPRF